MQLQHIGKIIAMANGSITVLINNISECAGCNARLLCSHNSADGHLTIPVKDPSMFSIGDTVKITTEEESQQRAIRLGLLYPCIILIIIAALLICLGLGQTRSAICAFGSVLIYYSIVYLLSHKIDKTFHWTVHKLI